MVVIPLEDARRFIDPNIGFNRESQYTSRKATEPSSYRLAMHISEGNKKINQKRKEPYNPIEPELSETPPLAIPIYEGASSASYKPAVVEVPFYHDILEKLKSVGAIDEEGRLYKKNGTPIRGNAFVLVSYSLNKRSKLKKWNASMYTLAHWIRELRLDPHLFNKHFQSLLKSPRVTRSKARQSSTSSTPRASRTPGRTPSGWINF
jgi:hypothetical protein